MEPATASPPINPAEMNPEQATLKESRPLQGTVDRVQGAARVSPTPGNGSSLDAHAFVPTSATAQVQSATQEILKTTPLVSFEPFLQLTNHLMNLANPYVVPLINDLLQQFCDKSIDPSDEKNELSSFENAFLSASIKQALTHYVSAVIQWAKSLRSPQEQVEFLNLVRAQLKEFNETLRKKNLAVLQELAPWKEFETLFRLPVFLKLEDNDYKEILGYIQKKNKRGLRTFVDTLSNKISSFRQEAEIKLKEQGYLYDLDTLLGHVIDKRPKKKEGIKTFWDHPEAHFINKSFSIEVPGGEKLFGTIERCERVNKKSLILYLHEGIEIHIYISGEVYIVKPQFTQKLLDAIQHGLLVPGEEVIIQHSAFVDMKQAILPGTYILMSPKEVKPVAGFIGAHYFEFYLYSSTRTPLYHVKGFYGKEKITRIELKLIPSEMTVETSSRTFERTHRAIKKDRRQVKDIHEANLDSCVFVKEEPNEETIKLQQSKKIENLLELIADDIQNNTSLLDTLLDDLVKNSLREIDFNILIERAPALAKRIQDACESYFNTLGTKRTPGEVLKQLILEINYASKVDKRDNIVNAKRIELLTTAYSLTEKLRDKAVSLVVGNTGSGKSTSIGFMMGAKFDEVPNQAGEKVVRLRVDPVSSHRTKEYPTIGQSIASSETRYPQGFEVPGGYLFVDFPGFNDTRGGDYELCTNLCMDHVVKSVSYINSIVVVAPASALTGEKGNHLIELINMVKERFPLAFRLDSNPTVFLLLTKQNQVEQETCSKIEDGTLFHALVNETSHAITALKAQRAELEDYEVRALERRLLIWQTLQRMHPSQIRLIDLKDESQRQELPALFGARSVHSSPLQYVNAMFGDYMQNSFADCVQSWAHTWYHNILGPFLNALPGPLTPVQKIEHATKELRRKKDQIEELERERQKRIDDSRLIQMQIKAQEAYVQMLNAGHPDAAETLLRMNSTTIAQKTGDINTINSYIHVRNVRADELQCAMNENEKRMVECSLRKEALEAQLKKLNTGTKEKVLFERRYSPNEKILKRTWKSEEAIEAALKDLSKNDLYFDSAKSGTINVSKYTGSIADMAVIQKGYRLIPADEVERDRFIKTRVGGGYAAVVEGHGFTIDRECRYVENGHKIGYGFTLEFKERQPLPWIKITFSIPNSAYNAVAIEDLESEIESYDETLRGLISYNVASGLNKTKLEEGIQFLQEKKANLENEIALINSTPIEQQMMKWKQDLQKWIQEKRDKETQLQDFRELDQQIERLKAENTEEKKKLKMHQNDQRNLAIIIATHWESARLLRKFVKIVLAPENSYPGNGEAIKRCREFIELFDTHESSLLRQIKTEYGF